MHLTSSELREVTLQVAREQFARRRFEHRPLMDAVERRVREMGLWDAADDNESGSTAKKSKGLAKIDYAVSNLKAEGRLRRRRPQPLGGFALSARKA